MKSQLQFKGVQQFMLTSDSFFTPIRLKLKEPKKNSVSKLMASTVHSQKPEMDSVQNLIYTANDMLIQKLQQDAIEIASLRGHLKNFRLRGNSSVALLKKYRYYKNSERNTINMDSPTKIELIKPHANKALAKYLTRKKVHMNSNIDAHTMSDNSNTLPKVPSIRSFNGSSPRKSNNMLERLKKGVLANHYRSRSEINSLKLP
jgi:hypothetical protein